MEVLNRNKYRNRNTLKKQIDSHKNGNGPRTNDYDCKWAYFKRKFWSSASS
jgi:hypothetical protein